MRTAVTETRKQKADEGEPGAKVFDDAIVRKLPKVVLASRIPYCYCGYLLVRADETPLRIDGRFPRGGIEADRATAYELEDWEKTRRSTTIRCSGH